MSRWSKKADGLRPISKNVEWKLLYQRVPLSGNANRPSMALVQLNRRTVREEPTKEEPAEPEVVGRS